jgi:dTDP-4-dehydrorhamnose reductase
MPSGLVVGADGKLGRVLLAELRAAGWSAGGTTRREQGQEGLVGLDLAEPPDRFMRDARLGRYFTEGPFTVFLLAAATSYERCEKDPVATRIVNVDHTVELARRLMQRGAFAVFPSSSAVFGDSGAQAPGEGAATRPTTEYGRQKASAEHAIAGFVPAAPANAGAAIVRIAKVVNAGDRFGGWMENLAGGTPIEAARDLMLSPVSPGYVVRGLTRIAERRQSGFYHLSGARDVSYFQFACMLARALGRSPSLVRALDRRASLGGTVSNSGRLEMGDASRRAGLEPQALESAVTDLITEFRGGR